MPASTAPYTGSASVSAERNHSLDLVRAAALLLGIAFHAGLSFYPGQQMWIVMDDSRSTPIAWTGFVLHSFRMAAFFLLAGYFGRMMYHRRGAGGFILSRIKRIAVPLVLFWPLLFVAFGMVVVWGLTKQWGITADMLPPPPPMTAASFPLLHLWFLYVLIMFYALMLIVRAVIARVDRSGALRERLDDVVGVMMRTGLLPVVLALPVAGLLLLHTGWMGWVGVPTPDIGLVPNLAAFGTYFIAFSIGWVLQRRADALEPLKALWPIFLGMAAGLTLLLLAPIGGKQALASVAAGTGRTISAIAFATLAWAYTFGFIGLALRFFRNENRVTRYLADASYWLYLIHLPIVIAMQVWVMKWSWPAEVKLVFILAVSVTAMLASYQVLVRYTPIGWLLNGKRRRIVMSKPKLAMEPAE